MTHLDSLLSEKTVTAERYYRPLRFSFILSSETEFTQIKEIVEWCNGDRLGFFVRSSKEYTGIPRNMIWES